jgi:hypothetical protein
MTAIEASAYAKEWQMLLVCAAPNADAEQMRKLISGVDFQELLQLADEHGVSGLLAAQVRNLGPELVPTEAQEQLQEMRRRQLLASLGMTAELLALFERFARTGIEALALKGPVLSVQAYGDAGMRQFGDLDFLVRGRDIHRVTGMMIEAGYEAKVPLAAIEGGKIPGEYVFRRTRNRLLVEFHTGETLRYFPRKVDVEGMFLRQIRVRIDAHDVPALSLEDEFVMLCVHGAKDLWERLLWIADIAALPARQTSIDWRRTSALATEASVPRMLHVGLRLAADLLAAPLPEKIKAEVLEDAAAEKLAAQIATWVSAAGTQTPGIMERAMLRMRLCGGLIAGPLYLIRLSLSPTEADWSEGQEGMSGGAMDAIRRPFRLARKYGRDGKR